MNAATWVIWIAGSIGGAVWQLPSQQFPPAEIASAGTPRLVAPQRERNEGCLGDEHRVNVEFPVSNSGTAILVLTPPQPASSSGCSRHDPIEIPPGCERTVSIAFDPHGKRGPQRQHVVYNTNDPVTPQVTFEFRCEIQPVIEIDPPMASFGEVSPGKTARTVVKMTGPKACEATYVSTTKGRWIDPRVLRTSTIDSGGQAATESLIEFSLAPGAPAGPLVALATVRTTDPAHPLIEIQVSADVRHKQ